MARLVVVSRNAALPFALNSAGQEVVTVDDDHDVRWGEYVDQSDVVVLDIDDPGICSLLIDGVARSASHAIRVLLLASNNPSWAAALAQRTDGVTVLPLPLTMPRLMAALDALTQGPPLPRDVQDSLGAPVPTPSATPPTPEPEADPTAPSPVLPVADALPEPEPEPTVPDQVPPVSPPSPAPSPATPEHHRMPQVAVATTRPSAVGWTSGGQQISALTGIPSPAPASGTASLVPLVEPLAPRAISLVRALTAAVDQLDSVTDTAEVVLSEAMTLVPADAGAVLVRDGAAWRVSAGAGLRALEERRTLTPEHWLVQQVSESLHGVLLSGGEGRWSELYGAPLSARPFLLATPLPPGGAILLLGRDDEEFRDPDLETLFAFSDEAGHLLADATDERRLARHLEPFFDPVD
jgi:hypothetical protein